MNISIHRGSAWQYFPLETKNEASSKKKKNKKKQ